MGASICHRPAVVAAVLVLLGAACGPEGEPGAAAEPATDSEAARSADPGEPDEDATDRPPPTPAQLIADREALRELAVADELHADLGMSLSIDFDRGVVVVGVPDGVTTEDLPADFVTQAQERGAVIEVADHVRRGPSAPPPPTGEGPRGPAIIEPVRVHEVTGPEFGMSDREPFGNPITPTEITDATDWATLTNERWPGTEPWEPAAGHVGLAYAWTDSTRCGIVHTGVVRDGPALVTVTRTDPDCPDGAMGHPQVERVRVLEFPAEVVDGALVERRLVRRLNDPAVAGSGPGWLRRPVAEPVAAVGAEVVEQRRVPTVCGVRCDGDLGRHVRVIPEGVVVSTTPAHLDRLAQAVWGGAHLGAIDASHLEGGSVLVVALGAPTACELSGWTVHTTADGDLVVDWTAEGDCDGELDDSVEVVLAVDHAPDSVWGVTLTGPGADPGRTWAAPTGWLDDRPCVVIDPDDTLAPCRDEG